jgi:biotin synthase
MAAKHAPTGIATDEANRLIRVTAGRDLEVLLDRAAEARAAAFGQEVGLCAIVNAKSGLCSEDCSFCAQSSRAGKRGVPIHGLLPTHGLTERAASAEQAGATHFSIVTSGRRIGDESEMATLERSLQGIARATRLHRCASLGFMDAAHLERLQKAGLQRYHHNLETARSHFSRICTTHTFEQKLATIHAARATGLSVCSGGIFGVGESPEQRVELADTLRELGVDAVPINFLDARPGTPLERQPRLEPEQCLATIAVFRLMLPQAEITVMGGREAQLGELQAAIFRAGASATLLGAYLTRAGPPLGDVLATVRQQGLRPRQRNGLVRG